MIVEKEHAPPLERLAYSVREAAKVCGLSKQTLYAQADAGRLELKKVGRKTFITREELQRFLAEAPTKGSTP